MKRKIPYTYVSTVKATLVGAAAVSPLGLFGGIDTVGFGVV